MPIGPERTPEMLQALGRRERRPLWVVSAIVLAVGLGLAVWAAIEGRSEAIREAAIDAELTAQAELAPLLQPRDLIAPVVGERHASLGAAIAESITSKGPIEEVRIYSPLGRILYASNASYVGARPSYLRDVTFQVAGGEPQNLIRNDLLQTYVPIWLNPDGKVAVAELTQSYGPIEAKSTSWYLVALISGGLMLACLAMVIVSGGAGIAQPMPQALYHPAVPRRRPMTESPVYQHSRFRVIEEQRQDVQRRAEAAEENFRSAQKHLKDTLAQMKQLEGRLAMNETDNTSSDGELQALRDQLRETSERLHKAEIDNNALRERMTLRQQELDEARQFLPAAGTNVDPVQLKARLEEAEMRTAEMSHEIERLESELEYTNSKFHMTKLSEALREFDNDMEEPTELEEPPIVIHSVSAPSKQQRAG
ncbi:MAG: hypothetical protein WD965_09695 [Actinomycetota bacterium]